MPRSLYYLTGINVLDDVIYDITASMDITKIFQPHGQATKIVFSKDNRYIAILYSRSNTLEVGKLTDEHEYITGLYEMFDILDVVFNSNTTILVYNNQDAIEEWDIVTGTRMRVVSHIDSFRGFSRDGRMTKLVRNKFIELQNTNDGNIIQEFERYNRGVELHCDHIHITNKNVITYDMNKIRVFNTNGDLVATKRVPKQQGEVLMSSKALVKKIKSHRDHDLLFYKFNDDVIEYGVVSAGKFGSYYVSGSANYIAVCMVEEFGNNTVRIIDMKDIDNPVTIHDKHVSGTVTHISFSSGEDPVYLAVCTSHKCEGLRLTLHDFEYMIKRYW